jgi:hypothetical protein
VEDGLTGLRQDAARTASLQAMVAADQRALLTRNTDLVKLYEVSSRTRLAPSFGETHTPVRIER